MNVFGFLALVYGPVFVILAFTALAFGIGYFFVFRHDRKVLDASRCRCHRSPAERA